MFKIVGLLILMSPSVYAMKWQGRPQSTNIEDQRGDAVYSGMHRADAEAALSSFIDNGKQLITGDGAATFNKCYFKDPTTKGYFDLFKIDHAYLHQMLDLLYGNDKAAGDKPTVDCLHFQVAAKAFRVQQKKTYEVMGNLDAINIAGYSYDQKADCKPPGHTDVTALIHRVRDVAHQLSTLLFSADNLLEQRATYQEFQAQANHCPGAKPITGSPLGGPQLLPSTAPVEN